MSDLTAYENLANAIVLQAVDDYRTYTRKLKALNAMDTSHMNERKLYKHQADIKDLMYEIAGIDRFFDSKLFTCLTGVEPQVIKRKLREEAEAM